MPRPPRVIEPGSTHHVTARGVQRRDVFLDDEDRLWLLKVLTEAALERRWQVQSYCLMPNHLHLLVRTPDGDLSAGLQHVLGRHGRRFNERHDRVGHLFQGRFFSREVRNDLYHRELFRYLAHNPVKAGLVREPGAYLWSAHNALADVAAIPALLDLAGRDQACGGRAGYLELVGEVRESADLLAGVLGDGAPHRIRAALAAGFSLRAIGAAQGVSKSTVLNRARRP